MTHYLRARRRRQFLLGLYSFGMYASAWLGVGIVLGILRWWFL